MFYQYKKKKPNKLKSDIRPNAYKFMWIDVNVEV